MELKYSKHNIQSLRKMFWQLPQNQENVIFEVDWDVKAKKRNFIFKIINQRKLNFVENYPKYINWQNVIQWMNTMILILR